MGDVNFWIFNLSLSEIADNIRFGWLNPKFSVQINPLTLTVVIWA